MKKNIKTIFVSLLSLFILCNFFSTININAVTQELNQKDTTNPSPNGFFQVQEIDGIWWLIDPNGEKFYATGDQYVYPNNFYYGDTKD